MWRMSHAAGPMVPEWLRSAAAAFRSELGISTTGAVVMSGHQPGFWHAGILAKVLAVNAACERSGAAGAWVVVDHDPDSPVAMRFPTVGWTERTVRFVPERAVSPCGVAPAAGVIAKVETSDLDPAVWGRVQQMIAAMSAHATSANLAAQLTLATADVLDGNGLGGAMFRHAVYATAIAKTALCRSIVESWRDAANARAAVLAYNAAAQHFPEADIRALAVKGDDVELPLWRLVKGGQRERVMASELALGADGDLDGDWVPRALMMTMLLRLAGCDLFVHGLGGGNYDRVMEAWVAAWLPGARLAPSAVVSATVLLDAPGAELADAKMSAQRAAQQVLWRAQAAAHRPEMFGDEQRAAQKRALLLEIRGLKGKKMERRDAFLRLQALLKEHRAAQRDGLGAMRADAEMSRPAAKGASLVPDRTWPWALHATERLHALKHAVDQAFGVGV